jgi:hypothetical protein
MPLQRRHDERERRLSSEGVVLNGDALCSIDRKPEPRSSGVPTWERRVTHALWQLRPGSWKLAAERAES